MDLCGEQFGNITTHAKLDRDGILPCAKITVSKDQQPFFMEFLAMRSVTHDNACYILSVDEIYKVFGCDLIEISRDSDRVIDEYRIFYPIAIHCVFDRNAIYVKLSVCSLEIPMGEDFRGDYISITQHTRIQRDTERLKERMQIDYETVCIKSPKFLYDTVLRIHICSKCADSFPIILHFGLRGTVCDHIIWQRS